MRWSPRAPAEEQSFREHYWDEENVLHLFPTFSVLFQLGDLHLCCIGLYVVGVGMYVCMYVCMSVTLCSMYRLSRHEHHRHHFCWVVVSLRVAKHQTPRQLAPT